MTDFQKSNGPLPAEATFDPLLTNTAVLTLQDEAAFNVASTFPDLPVQLPAGKYKVYDKGAFFRDEVGPRPLGGTLRVTGFSMSDRDYSVEEEGLSTLLDVRTRKASVNPTQLEKGKVQLVTQQIRIHIARAWVNGFFRAGIWAQERLGVAGGPGANQFLQFEQAGADPVSYVRKERVGFRLRSGGLPANVMVVGVDLHRVLCDHPEIRDRIPNTQLGVATMQLLAQLFEVEEYIVAGAVYNAAAEGQPDDMRYIVNSRSFALFHRTPNPGDPEAPTAGRVITWDSLVPGGGKKAGVWRWNPNPYAESFDVRTALSMHRVSSDLGVFYQDAIGANA